MEFFSFAYLHHRNVLVCVYFFALTFLCHGLLFVIVFMFKIRNWKLRREIKFKCDVRLMDMMLFKAVSKY